jgi:cellulose synthase/poly-beta-1,6-N-acetylglucosamine synthase-like glycosyltransferase
MISEILDWLNSTTWLIFSLGVIGISIYHLVHWRADSLLAKQLASRRITLPMLQRTPKVSVLVAAWNEAQIIEKHLASIRSLSYPDLEYILCAGGSDHTLDKARRLALPDWHIMEQMSGEGKQRALQHCLELATGEWIILTDADTLLDDAALNNLLAPLANEGEAVATGRIRPFDDQLKNAFVLQRWFMDIYVSARLGRYVRGLTGANAVISRTLLDRCGGFREEVPSGTDYFLAKRLLQYEVAIRFVSDSAVKTWYPQDLREYSTQQQRWLRNVVGWGLHFKEYGEAMRSLVPSMLGLGMLLLPWAAFWIGPLVLVAWLLAFSHVIFNRVRYLRFGEMVAQVPLPVVAYISLPMTILLDFSVWSWALVQYPIQAWRRRW